MATVAKSRKTKADEKKPRRRAYLPAAERRKLIIEAAQQVFARSNLQGARTRDIAKEAQVNQATIFEHFESKEQLFQEAVVKPLIDAMSGMYERVEVYEKAASPDEMASLALESARRHVCDILKIFPLLTAALFSDPDLGRKLYREQIAPLIRERGEVLDGLAREGLDLDFIGLANFGMLFAIALDRYFGEAEGEVDIDYFARQFTRMSTGGFARDKAGKAIRESMDGSET